LKKVHGTVLKETKFVGAWVLIFSALMQAVFLIIQKWDYTVLLGNILSAAAGIISFFFLGITIIKAVSSGDPAYAKKLMRASQAIRTFFLFGIALLGALLPCFNIWATVIPIIFPRLALLIRSFMVKRMGPYDEPVIDGESREITDSDEEVDDVD
jgi:hypothetical protein